jgi:hypothetical protein
MKNQSYCNLVEKAKQLVRNMRVSSGVQGKLMNKCGKVALKDRVAQGGIEHC